MLFRGILSLRPVRQVTRLGVSGANQRLVGGFSTAGHGLPLSWFLDRFAWDWSLFPDELYGR